MAAVSKSLLKRHRHYGYHSLSQEKTMNDQSHIVAALMAAVILALTAAPLCIAQQAGSNETGRAAAPDQPIPRTDRNSQTAHAQLLEKARQGRIDVYFVGDSITRRWGTSDEQYRAFLENWRQNFFGWNA